MEKKTIMWAFAVFIIGAFILELFVVVLYAPQQAAQNPVPTPETSADFTGNGYGKATILGFDDNVLVECTTNNTRASSALDGIKGVRNAFFATESIMAVKLNESYSSSAFAEIFPGLNSTLTPFCDAKFVRGALINVDSIVVYDSLNRSHSISQRDLENYAFLLGQTGPTAFVFPEAVENESIDLVASVSFKQGRVSQFLAQQIIIASNATG